VWEKLSDILQNPTLLRTCIDMTISEISTSAGYIPQESIRLQESISSTRKKIERITAAYIEGAFDIVVYKSNKELYESELLGYENRLSEIVSASTQAERNYY
jgi:hypothetical protein